MKQYRYISQNNKGRLTQAYPLTLSINSLLYDPEKFLFLTPLKRFLKKSIRLLLKPSILPFSKEEIYEGPECTQTYMRILNKFLTPLKRKRRRFLKKSIRLTNHYQILISKSLLRLLSFINRHRRSFIFPATTTSTIISNRTIINYTKSDITHC